MLDTALVLLAIAVLLATIAAMQPLAAWLRLPPAVLLAGFGIGIGALSSGLVLHGWLGADFDIAAHVFDSLPVGSETIIYVFLPLLVFEAGSHLQRRAAHRRRRRADPRAGDRREERHHRSDRSGAVADRRRAAGRLPVAGIGRGDDRSSSGDRDLPRCRRPGAVDPAGVRRSAAQRCRGDSLVCRSARHDRIRPRAEHRARRTRVRHLLPRRRRARDRLRPCAAVRDPMAARRPACRGKFDGRVLAYFAFIAGERGFHVSGVVSVLVSGPPSSARSGGGASPPTTGLS